MASLKKRWNLDPLIANKTLPTSQKIIQKCVQEICSLRGKIFVSPENIKSYFSNLVVLNEHIDCWFCYFENKSNENLANQEISKKYEEFSLFCNDCSTQLSFIEKEIYSSEKSIKKHLLINNDLKVYNRYFEHYFYFKKHMLDEKTNKIISEFSPALSGPRKIFTKLTNVNFHFPKITDKNGKTYELLNSNYSYYIQHHDSVLRKNAYFAFWAKYYEFSDSIAECYVHHLYKTCAWYRLKKYKSPCDGATKSDFVDEQFYDFLLNKIRSFSNLILDWKKILQTKTKIKNPSPWDWTPPLFDNSQTFLPEKSLDIIYQTVSVFGDDYVQKLKKLISEQTIDWFPHHGKRSGAYSYGIYKHSPYILLNWTGKYLDLSTLIHEAGHAMHSIYSSSTQPYIYHDYPIFLAEIASITNEVLLVDKLLASTQNVSQKKFYLEKIIREFIATVFRQAQFADFEKKVHDCVWNKEGLNAKKLQNIYQMCAKKYFPKLPEETYTDKFDGLTCLYIPHFYSDFYVYKYCIGMIVAFSISEKIKTSPKMRDNYLSFLKSGNYEKPLDAIAKLGVDLRHHETYNIAFAKFANYLKILQNLIN